MTRIVGLMSGTSIDAIDVTVLDLRREDPAEGGDPSVLVGRLIAHTEHPWPAPLRTALLEALPPASSDVGAWNRLHGLVGEAFADAARRGIDLAGGVDLISMHGQTLHHGVEAGDGSGSLQIGDPARVAARCGLPVLADVRAADIARGGHGAPLVPILDALLVGDAPSAIVNIGGIANLTLTGGAEVVAGDVGPGNALLDAAVRTASGGTASMDRDARLARTGTVDEELLGILLDDPFYARPLPRSTGREHFDAGYVQRRAPAWDGCAADLLATLTELTARTLADAIRGSGAQRVIVSGGGAHNPLLRARLTALLAPLPVLEAEDESALGLPGDAKEAALMALLAKLTVEQIPGVLARADGTAITGARAPAILGSLTPPGALPAAERPGHPVRRLRFDAAAR
ncbi:MAG: anhydro-N-acetylmuramic acid kinase [Brachybacterium sp.]|nr:anhydro-N-acetylmuramic acid kinase [Brachybacterium sp.]